ncbi:MAG: RNA polymerase sigma factor [Acidobacteriota bacterium]|nr:RNA polymerase sigma factor [Acidobacteriota bacterium]
MSDTSAALAVERQIEDNRSQVPGFIFNGAALTMASETSRAPGFAGADPDALAGLIEKGRCGDLAAMESIYGLFKKPIYNMVFRHTANSAVAEDLLQDIFLKVFTHLDDVKSAETFPAWVFRIALNSCYSYLRGKRTRRQRMVPLSEIEGKPAEAAIAEPSGESDLKKPLQEAVEFLPERMKSVFILHDIQGFKHKEIGRMLNCSAGTSKSQLFKARLRIRDYLKNKRVI